MAHDVFISHSNKDKAVANAVVATLEREGFSCWIAPRNVLPGADWGQSLIKGIRSSRVFVLLLSSAANSSQHILREVERAVHMKIPIVPLRIEDVLPEGALEFHLSTVHWLDAFTPPVETHLQQLVATLSEILPHEAQPPAGSAPAASSPPLSPARSTASTSAAAASVQPAHLPDTRPSPRIERTQKEQKALQAHTKKASFRIFAALALLPIAGLVYWAAHRSDPFADLRTVNWATVQVDDAHFANCKGYAPCLDKKSQAEELKKTDWKQQPYDSKLFADCMGYQPCLERKEHAQKLVGIQDWTKAAHDDPAVLKDCMNYEPCKHGAASVVVQSLPTTPIKRSAEQAKCVEKELPACCADEPNAEACRACKKTLGKIAQDCNGIFKPQ